MTPFNIGGDGGRAFNNSVFSFIPIKVDYGSMQCLAFMQSSMFAILLSTSSTEVARQNFDNACNSYKYVYYICLNLFMLVYNQFSFKTAV